MHSSWLVLALSFTTYFAAAHENFLPLHHHSDAHAHDHGHEHIGHVHMQQNGKSEHFHESLTEQRFGFATGLSYTRYTTEDGRAHLGQTGAGIDWAALPWLHFGGDVSYGWFDSEQGSADGWLTPHGHVDVHLPLGGGWEVVTGLEIGFPGGDEALVGDHWEWMPHAELRYDRGDWFVEAGAGLVFIRGADDHEHAAEEPGDEPAEDEHGDEDHADQAHAEESHAHEADFHEIVDPHGEREFQYFFTAGVRLLEKRLTVETRLSAVHVMAGETPADNYVRGGLRATYEFNEQLLLTAEGNLPLTAAERNEGQVSLGLRVGF